MPAKRYYARVDGRKVSVPSVTTILKFVGDKGGLNHWYYEQGREAMRLELEEDHEPITSVWNMPKTAATIGTIVHAMIEADVHGVEFRRDFYDASLMEPADMAFGGWRRWKAARKFDVIASELSLVSQVGRYGGTQDLTMVDGERTLLDLKTGAGIYPEHLLQLAAYAGLWHENRPDEPLDALAILRISKTDGSYHWHSWPIGSPTVAAAARGFAAARTIYDVLAKELKGVG